MSKILVINGGSSSLKFALFENVELYLNGEIEKINTPDTKLWVKGALNYEKKCDILNQLGAVKRVLKILNECDISKIDAIGHRLVFGGDIFRSPTIINQKVLQDLKTLSSYDLLHMPSQIANIELLLQKFPDVVQVGCFDTCFHLKMPKKAKMFALSYNMYEEGIRRYGFHGLSFESIILNEKINYKKVIVVHLGAGSSICAIKDKISIDTTMGLTSLGGIPMEKRSGDLDPGVILYLLKEKKYTFEKLAKLLYEDSGLKAISGIADMKTLLDVKNCQKASDAIELFCYQIVKVIASYIAALQGIDAIVFTGGIGEKAPIIRKNVSNQLSFFNVHINDLANQQNETVISNDFSSVRVLVIPANEELVIIKHIMKLCFA